MTNTHSSHPLPVGSLRLDIFSQILLSIFTGEYPAGTRLKVQHLAKQYGVSTTPVREAIVELTGIGMVELIPNRGAVVIPFGVSEIREMYHVRRILEVESARCACKCIDLEEIKHLLEMTRALHQTARDNQWAVLCSDIDRRMHTAIVNAAGIQRLKAELTRYDRLMHMIRVVLKDSKRYLDQVLEEHLQILEALLRRDQEAVATAMAGHLQATCDRAVEGIFICGISDPENIHS